MKSEHRHDLKTNELRRFTSEVTRASEQYVHRHTTQLAIAVAALVLIGIGVAIWMNRSGSVERESWRAASSAASAEEFANVADKYPGTEIAAWARLREAEGELYTGVRLMFTDRAAGQSELKKSLENFEKLVAGEGIRSEIRERALFGLATCREAISGKNTDPAIEAYERLLNEIPNTIYKQVAEGRVAALRTGNAQDFYAWFQAQNPKPRDREMPKDLTVPPSPGPSKGSVDATPPSAPSKPAGDQSEAKPGAADADGKSVSGGGPALPAAPSGTTPAGSTPNK